MRINIIKPIFDWLYNDEHFTRTVVLICTLSVAIGIILCCFEAGHTNFIGKIGYFLLFTFVWAIELATVIPFLIGLLLSIASFIIALIKELLNK